MQKLIWGVLLSLSFINRPDLIFAAHYVIMVYESKRLDDSKKIGREHYISDITDIDGEKQMLLIEKIDFRPHGERLGETLGRFNLKIAIF